MWQAYLAETATDPNGREAMVTSRSDEVAAHPALFAGDTITHADVTRIRETLQLERLSAAITANGRSAGVIDDPTRDGLAAFVKLDAPGWYLVVRDPGAAGGATSWIQALLFGMVAGLLVFLQLCLPPQRRGRAPSSDANMESGTA